jgi:cytochrome bd-type quinol oxidase subunit 1
MDLPVIQTPIFKRALWMEEVTYSHIPIATIITAFMLLAPLFEYIGYRRKDLRYDRLSRSFIYWALILFSPGAALGTGIPMFIIGLYPEFWSRWANLFFWPLIVQFGFFTLEVIFLFFGYYLTWDRMMNRKRLHIFFGSVAALWGLLVQVVWDSLGAYMSTPSVALPAVNQPVAFSLPAMLNPSFITLFVHRFFGNISYTMFLVGGISALMYGFKKEPKEKEYYGFATDFTFTIGFLAFFAQPFLGWAYAGVFQREAPVIFHAIMGGHAAVYFLIKMSLIAVFLIVAGVYIFTRHKHKKLLLAVASLAFASLYIILYRHPALNWFGSETAWRVVYTVVLGGGLVVLWLLQWKGPDFKFEMWRGYRWLLFIGAAGAFFTFALGGYVRERSRSPYSVYEEIEKPEARNYEVDRALVYDRCVGCHHLSPRDLKDPHAASWEERIAIERERAGVALTDDEAERIVRYLKEKYPDVH